MVPLLFFYVGSEKFDAFITQIGPGNKCSSESASYGTPQVLILNLVFPCAFPLLFGILNEAKPCIKNEEK
jgi:hypothetical protein